MVRTPLVMSGDVAYWRALAEERKRQIDALHARLLAVIEAVPDAQLRAFLAALDVAPPAWSQEIDALKATTDLDRDDVTNVLSDLWRRVAIDHSP
ncbi:MAG TPA: hypothetical protein VN181_00585 [Thermoanaerobaculia bacterium]|nr:hypothetical protein [Thermoanaerobaculia bacterium]